MMTKLLQGDCLKLMQDIPDKSIDMILCDLPYGTSACKWDEIIPFKFLWEQYSRIIKDDGAIVLFGCQPFTSKLIVSNLELYKYNWVWIKDNATNFLNKKYQAGKITEDICVFGKMATSYSKNGNMKYFPQMETGKPYKTTNNVKSRTNAVIRSEIVNVTTDNKGTRYPNNVLYFNRDKDKLHSTQKPVPLLEYLIKTYTNENELVLDNCFGSCSTGVACINTNRNFIGMELNEEFFKIGKQRIDERLKELGYENQDS